MLPRFIGALLSRSRTKRLVEDQAVPVLEDATLALLMGGGASALRALIRQATTKEDGTSLEKRLREKADQLGWNADEISKIAILFDYYRGAYQLAGKKIIAAGFENSDPDMFALACMSMYMQDDFEGAYALLRTRDIESLKHFGDPDFLSFAGYIALSAGAGVEASLAYFDAPLEMGQVTTAYVTNAYPVYFEAGRLRTVADLHHHIHKYFIQDPQAVYALACVELARGYYPEGFRLAECRYEHPDVTQFINGDLFDKPRWKGESLAGKRLLVHAEQGLGDMLMCARYLPALVQSGASVSAEIHEIALSLLAPNFPDVDFLQIHRKIAANAEFDYWVGAMSLPYLFGTTFDSVPCRAGYLVCPDEHRQYWQTVLAESDSDRKPRIGIAWSGNPRHRADRRRSMKFDLLRSYIAEHPEWHFVSLQTDVPLNCPDNLSNFSEELVTLADTAALIQEMDLVITVDTSVVHLAGALGRPTWLLLPFRYEWRWGLEGESNPWYESVSVLRQPNFENWKAVLDDVFGRRLPAYMAELMRKEA